MAKDDLTEKAITWLNEHWLRPVAGIGDVEQLIGIKASTLKTRVGRGHAMALHTQTGGIRNRIEFSPAQLVYNLLQHAFSQHRFSIDGLESGHCPKILEWCKWTQKHILSGPRYDTAVFRILDRAGNTITHEFEDDEEVMRFTGEPAMIIPISSIVFRMAIALYVHRHPDALTANRKAGD